MTDIKVHQTNILPLRWFANMCGSIACWSILKAAYLDEDENYGWQYKMHGIIHKLTWPISYKYGSHYEFSIDMSGPDWDDYDENGIPYWEKTGTVDPDYKPLTMNKEQLAEWRESMDKDWDFEDFWTRDAFRIIKKV